VTGEAEQSHGGAGASRRATRGCGRAAFAAAAGAGKNAAHEIHTDPKRFRDLTRACAPPRRHRWSGGGGVSGKSLNIYRHGRWHQTWVDNSGTLLMLAGGLAGRSMVLSATGPSASDPKAIQQQRITWTPASDGSVRQLWESSSDSGRTWVVLFDGRYVRAK
jgi:hypothetical protein